jgi:MoaA/NifB/PqqE/SkfB family radical SAM enzyme
MDIIWNITRLCPWACDCCCVDAIQVRRQGEQIRLWSSGNGETALPYLTENSTVFEQAVKQIQSLRSELTLDEKLQVLENVRPFAPKIDFSGGDPLIVSENLEVIKRAASDFGRAKVTLTATGAGFPSYKVADVAPHIGELNFTYDSPDFRGNANRQPGYASGNLHKASEFVQAGVQVRAECPMSVFNVSPELIREMFTRLHEQGIQKFLLMRLFPSGRGGLAPDCIPSPEQYRTAIKIAREMEAKLSYPKVLLQCALKLFDRTEGGANPCNLLRESFGLMWDGTLLFSPWAIGPDGRPMDDTWVVGNLATTPMETLLRTPKVTQLRARLNENFGECKIFSYIHSRKVDPFERMLDHADPLFHVVNRSDARSSLSGGNCHSVPLSTCTCLDNKESEIQDSCVLVESVPTSKGRQQGIVLEGR